jgi:molecular chaperone GrpE
MKEPTVPPGSDERGGIRDESRTGEGAESVAPPTDAAGEPTAPAAAESSEALRDRWLRAEAELQNLRRRAARDTAEARRAAEERVMLEIVAALDDLDRALDAAHEGTAPGAWAAGVRLVGQRLREFLAREGVRVLDPAGTPFDPVFHEAILEVDAPAGVEAGAVVEVVLKGYARGDRLLRPARVVVARAPRPAGT